MKLSTFFGFAFSLAALVLSGSALPRVLTAVAEPDSDVIVILRDQLPGIPGARGAHQGRAAAILAAQQPILDELQRAGAHKTHSFATINAVAASLKRAEIDLLSAHPLVYAVVPNRVIKMKSRKVATANARSAVSAANAAPSASSALCGTLEPEALQLTNTAFLNTATPSAQTTLDGNGVPITGVGVKVAYLADGLDPGIPGFIRADGSRVFIDYQDFSGDPAGTPTPGEEAFGDAGSIAAQDVSNHAVLTYDISQYVNPAHPLPTPCKIRIRGVAPGASLVGLKVFGVGFYSTDASFVDAIEYAYTHDDVDVINESFASNATPNNNTEPISLANQAAVQAGVVITVAAGDAGTNGTLGSPSTDPYVISAAASTQFRLYAQAEAGGMPLATNNGYVSNNISGFSSGGYSQAGALTPSLVAPGDEGWSLCSPNSVLYTQCVNLAGTATPILIFGGTSEAAPLTAGEAALVIQAYRSTHGGASPSPALVKEIIMSTAGDLGAPAFEQGAGLINSLAAVNAALSVQDANGAPAHPTGDSLLMSPSLLAITAAPGSAISQVFSITNTGTTTQHLTPALQRLAPPFAGATIDVQLHPDTDPTFLNSSGAPRSYVKQSFVVPAGTQHLDAAIAFLTNPPDQTSPFVYFGLFDPAGREVTYSIPQGAGSGYGHTDVVQPAAGTWTAYIWTRPAGVAGSYTGTDVQFTWSAERFVSFGSLTPSSLTLAPGASAQITAAFDMPAAAGDSSAAIRFSPSAGSVGTRLAQIPISLRTLVPINAAGGNFTGTLTGGNGRASVPESQTFAFNVPSGVKNMSLAVNFQDPGYVMEGFLVDPNGMELSIGPSVDPGDSGILQSQLQLNRAYPQAGQWRFVLLQNYFSSGKSTSQSYSGQIRFNTAQITAPGLPAGTRLQAGVPVMVPVSVTNNGAVAQWYFADGRLAANTALQLTDGEIATCGLIGIPGCTRFYLPPEVVSANFTVASTVPVALNTYDVTAGLGGPLYFDTQSPWLFGAPAAGNTATTSISEPEVPFGPWLVVPAEAGPTPVNGDQPAPYRTVAVLVMKPFDSAVTADSGDAWTDLVLNTNTFNPLELAPGQSGTINVTFTPTAAQAGKSVSGFLYIDTFNLGLLSGDEVVRLPYSYSVVN